MKSKSNQTRFSRKFIGASLLVSTAMFATSTFAAPGDTYGDVDVSKKSTVFRIGGSAAGSSMYTSGLSDTTHRGNSGSQSIQSSIGLDASLLKKTLKIFDVASRGTARYGKAGPNVGLVSTVKLVGVTVADASKLNNKKTAAVDTGKKSYTKDLWKGSAAYYISGIKVKVSGKINGTVWAQSQAKTSIQKSPALVSSTSRTFADSGAAVYGYGTAAACFVDCGLAGLGVTTQIKILDGILSSDSEGSMFDQLKRASSSRVVYQGKIKADSSYSVGAGTFKIWGKLLGLSKTKKLASWGDFISKNKSLHNLSYNEAFAYTSSVSNPPAPPPCIDISMQNSCSVDANWSCGEAFGRECSSKNGDTITVGGQYRCVENAAVCR